MDPCHHLLKTLMSSLHLMNMLIISTTLFLLFHNMYAYPITNHKGMYMIDCPLYGGWVESCMQLSYSKNSGGRKLWRIDNFKNLVGKTLVSCSELSSSSSINTSHSHALLNIKSQSLIITCGTKMVRAFAVSSVVRG